MWVPYALFYYFYKFLLEDRLYKALRTFGHEITGNIFINIGANIGPHSLLLSYMFRHCSPKIYAVEPEHWNFNVLTKMIKAFSLQRIIFPQFCALGNWSGEGRLLVHQWHPAGHSLLPFQRQGESYGHASQVTQRIEVLSLKDFIKDKKINPKDIGLITLDIEGGEWDVLENQEWLLKYNIHWFVEWRKSTPESCQKMLRFFLQNHYGGVVYPVFQRPFHLTSPEQKISIFWPYCDIYFFPKH